MRILFVVRDLSKGGGVSRYIDSLVRQFSVEHDVHVLAASFEEDIPRVVFHRKIIPRNPFWLQVLSNCIQNEWYIRKLDKKFHFDIVHTATGESLTGDIGTAHSCHVAAIKKLNETNKKEKPFFYYVIYKILRSIRPLNIVVRVIEKYGIEFGCKRILSVSHGVAEELLENFHIKKEKISVIPNGVDIEEFKPNGGVRKKIRESLGISDDCIILVFSGYEFERKGLRFVLCAMLMIKNDIKLIVAGGGNVKKYQNICSKMGLSDRVIFLGTISNMNDIFAASDIFVFPTKYEPFGLVITEAMASSLAVITSKSAGAAELMTDGYDCKLLNNPTDSNEIAENITLLIDNEKLRKDMSINARKTAEKYSWEIIAQQTMDIYKEVIREKNERCNEK